MNENINKIKMTGSITMLKNRLTELLNIEYPIIQAPMAGGVTTSKLVASVSNAGGLGMVGAGYMTPNQMRTQIRELKQLTPNPFGINLFVPNEFEVKEDEIRTSNQLMNGFRDELGLPRKETMEIPNSNSVYATFKEQIKVVVEEKVPICTFTFGIPPKEMIEEIKKQNILLMGTATTLKEAVANEKAGMDIIVVQGSEAGGHRGNFMEEDQESLIGLMSLIPQVVDHVGVPVVAAGGIMDGRGLMASICLGAKGVQMGTAFLTCMESGAHPVHKEAILNAEGDHTVLTRAFSGKWARGIKNRFISEMQAQQDKLPSFPVQNSLTQDIRKKSGEQNNPEFMSLWSGQSAVLAKNQTVEALIQEIVEEAMRIRMN